MTDDAAIRDAAENIARMRPYLDRLTAEAVAEADRYDLDDVAREFGVSLEDDQ